MNRWPVIIGVIASFVSVANAEERANKSPAHMGVQTCSGSTCHSRQEATGITVRQNEIETWRDAASSTGGHWRAYQTLLGERAKNITDQLGLGPAKDVVQCLTCHTDATGIDRQGPRFKVTDGVGCESCHGGSENWLDQHYKIGASHAQMINRGMIPLEKAVVRGEVCVSCHLGSETSGQFVTHQMMAAGHPRLSFELDLFTALQNHHDEDIDYLDRKSVQTGIEFWATGQVISVKRALTLFEDPRLSTQGIFPEPVFYDCLSCHRPISDNPSWTPVFQTNPGRPVTPGQIRYNDANIIMLIALASAIAPDMETRLDQEVRALHAALGRKGKSRAEAITALKTSADEMMTRIDGTKFTRQTTFDILNKIVDDALLRRYTDYTAAEQSIMAIDSLLSSLIANKQIVPSDVRDIRSVINAGYDAVEDPNLYDQHALTKALQNLRMELARLH